MPHYLTHDEYVSDQKQLKASIQDEFHQTERSIDNVRGDIKSLDDRVETQFKSVAYEFGRMHQRFEQVDRRFEQVDRRFEQIDQRFDRVDQRFDKLEADVQQLKVDFQRFSAQAQNSRIRNPHIRISPIATFNPVSGYTHTPNPTRFPKSAAEFYSLYKPTTLRKQAILDYLIDFYDITHIDVPKDKAEAHATTRSELAVGYLELILGLDENNII
ncbi:hypothetical protein ACHAPA_006619 [Fusarium lateritium]